MLYFPRPLNVFFAMGLCFACCLKTGFCLPATSPLPAYAIQVWGTDDGLPGNYITSIQQTHDGYLWVGTDGGLARFNGSQFAVFSFNNTPGFPRGEVTSLFEDKEENLWIGHEMGELTRYKDGLFNSVEVHPPWKDQRIWHIGSDPTNDLWLINPQGMFFRLKDDLLLVPVAGNIFGFHSYRRSDDGTMWIMRNGVLSVLGDDKFSVILFDQPNLTNAYIQAVCPSRDGGLWVASDGHLRKWNDHKWVDDLGTSPWQFGPVTQMIETRDGFLAVGTPEQGLFLIDPHVETLHYNHTNGFPSDSVRLLYEDREGDLWVGTRGSGLAVLRPSAFTTIYPPDNWQGRAVTGVTIGKDGELWAGTDGAGVYNYRDGQWTNYLGNWRIGPNVSTPYISTVAEEINGRVWIGTWGSGLFVKHGNDFEPAPGWKNIPTGTSITALLSGSNGSWWLGTSLGLARLSNDKISWPVPNGNNSLWDVRAVIEDKDGTIWFGMNGRGLACLKNGLVRQFRKTDGLASDFVRCLHLDEAGALWIGTSSGLSRFKAGRFATIKAEQGLPNEIISCIQDDGLGYFWIGSQGGVIRVSKTELNLCADGGSSSPKFWCYDKSDGMPTRQCSGGFQPAGCMDANGLLYFPTSKGLVKVNPANIKINPLPPPVVIEKISVDNQQIPVSRAATSPPKIQPGNHRFEFDYVGLSFVAPQKVHYKYRLNGLDAGWLDVGNIATADYSFIPPGHYTFSVTACNNDGVWNKTGADFSFIVLPFFWQTFWFRTFSVTLLVLAAVGVVWLDARRRMRRKLEHIQRQHAVEHERVRIANDIHDDLGTHLTRITMLSESARSDLEDREQAEADLDQIYDTARELTLAVDEIVWAVNPRHDTVESLTNYLGNFAQDFLDTAGICCRLDMPFRFPAWPLTSEARHNLFLAFKEALNNVVKHAAASEVHISLHAETDSFELTVEDNGHGFTHDHDEINLRSNSLRYASGNGLENMRRRLTDIGGQCDIRSRPGEGTKVRFKVPIRIHVA